jgi:hypothetical protein
VTFTAATHTSDKSQSSSLSTGEKAGVGVGVAIGVLAIIAILAWIIFQRRRRKVAQPEDNSSSPWPSAVYQSPEMEHKSVPSEMASPDLASPVELESRAGGLTHTYR